MTLNGAKCDVDLVNISEVTSRKTVAPVFFGLPCINLPVPLYARPLVDFTYKWQKLKSLQRRVRSTAIIGEDISTRERTVQGRRRQCGGRELNPQAKHRANRGGSSRKFMAGEGRGWPLEVVDCRPPDNTTAQQCQFKVAIAFLSN